MTTTKPAKPKRFYKDVSLVESDGRFGVQLDGRVAKTRAGAALTAPTEKLGEAVAQEWRDQGENIDLSTMLLTALLAGAIDSAGERAAKIDEIIGYLNSDMLCYRADAPTALMERQASIWDPFLKWLGEEMGAELSHTSGIVAIEQPAAAGETVGEALAGAGDEVLSAVRTATALTGSAVLALAMWRGAHEAEVIFKAAFVDEDYQVEQWGWDNEAETRRSHIRAEFDALDAFLNAINS